MMGYLKYVPGYRSGRLTIVERLPPKHLLVRCDCGVTKQIRLADFSSGATKSCGCLHREAITSHGACGTGLYKRWRYMMDRVAHHGGYTHVKVCKEWQQFENFKSWALANGYHPKLEIDRKDNKGDYCPDNCRWATRRTQCINRRKQLSTSSRFIGVCFDKSRNKWIATIHVNGRSHNLGRFDSEHMAAQARDRAAVRLHGDAAVLNFPSSPGETT